LDTAAISFRVIDFLKGYPPFSAVAERDLLALTTDGRVRFFEANDYLLWQGEPHKYHVFVIQQGTVSLWEDGAEQPTLRDVRGAGDLLGMERFSGARACLQSARAESDVLVYAFAEGDFAALLEQYPHVRDYVAGYGGATPYEAGAQRAAPHQWFMHDVTATHAAPTCRESDAIADVAARLLASPSQALVVVDAERRPLDVLTLQRVATWVAQGGGDARQPVSSLVRAGLATLGADASVTDAVLAMASGSGDAVALTTTGGADGALVGLATPRDLAPVFGDQPSWILGGIAAATDTGHLRALNARARAFTLASLAGADAVDWLSRFTHLVDAGIVSCLIALVSPSPDGSCWCVSGAAGRAESLTCLIPDLAVIVEDDSQRADTLVRYERVRADLALCGYLPHTPVFEPAFCVATLAEWQQRYRDWMTSPVLTQMYRARPLFDLRPVHGARALWASLEATVTQSVDPDFLRILAHDCLASLPPLTFFEDAVVDESGHHSAIFRLQHSALGPLVDVGRVFGLAAGAALGRSTLARFATARTLVPEHEAIFREASDAFRIVLWQQGRVGIGQGTPGFELPPALLSRYDRHLLAGRFRAILRLLQFTADLSWLEAL